MSSRFKNRIFVSVSLLLLCGVMMVTSVLMFTRSHNTTTALMHTVLGAVLLVMILWHLKNNISALQQYLKLKTAAGKNGLNTALPAALVMGAGLAVASFFHWAPLAGFYEWGAGLRLHDPDHPQTQLTYIKLEVPAKQAKGAALRIDLRTGPEFAWPQYALWLETLEGKLIQPLYVTRKLAESRFDTKVTRKADGLVFTSNPLDSGERELEAIFDFVDEPGTSGERARPESLPVFLNRLQQAAKTLNYVVTDGYAGATLQQSFLLDTRTRSPITEPYRVRFEINQSFDFNTYYSSDRFPEDPIYSGNGYSAQPSLIYEAVIDPNSDQRYYPMRLLGRGHHSGRDGEIHPDLHNMTTALYIIDRIMIEIPDQEMTL